MSVIELSVVSPFFNESDNLPIFLSSLEKELSFLKGNYEIILIDDGSSDDSFEIVAKLKIKNLTLVKLTKNFGHQNALDAGIREASGNWIITLDSDLQHPPAEIAKMLDLAKENKVDIVYGSQSDRKKDSIFKRFSATFYYKLMKVLTGIAVIPHSSDFRLISKKVATILQNLPEEKVFRLLLPSLGFSYKIHVYSAARRQSGKSKYTLWKMSKLALNSIFSFSTTPLRFVTTIGFVASLVAFLWTLVVLNSYFKGEVIPGWTSMSLIILMLGGVQLFAIGLVSEYLARNLEISKQRPNFIVEQVKKIT